MSRCEFYNDVSAKDRVQIFNIKQLKLKANENYKRDEKIQKFFEPSNNEGVVSKAYLDRDLSKIKIRLSLIQKDSKGYKLLNDKQSEEILFEGVVKTTIQILFGQGFFDNYDNADEVIKYYLLIDEVNDRRRPDLEELNDDNVNQCF